MRFERGDVTLMRRWVSANSIDFAYDIGCFHNLNADARRRYVSALTAVLKPGAFYMLYAFEPHADRAGVALDEIAALFDPAYQTGRDAARQRWPRARIGMVYFDETRVITEKMDAYSSRSVQIRHAPVGQRRDRGDDADRYAQHGLTVSGFLSVSLEPPLVLISIGEELTSEALLKESAAFVVNFLRDDQSELSDRFAGRLGAIDRLEGMPTRPCDQRCADFAGLPGLAGLPRGADVRGGRSCLVRRRGDGRGSE